MPCVKPISRILQVLRNALRLTPVLAVLSAPAHASTINVPGDKTTIAAAITAATNGDTILVADGTYGSADNLNLSINKSITIASVNGAASTTINCSSSHFAFVSANCTIQGFTFQNASGSNIGVLLMETGCTVSKCIFKNNTNFGGNGAAMQLNGGTTTITGCTFDHQSGSGAIGSSGGSATITDCAFTNGNAQSSIGGGAINLNTGTFTITRCTFDSNTAGGQAGGAIYWRNGSLTVTDSTFTNNSGFYGGVIMEGAQGIDSPATFTRCLFKNNSAFNMGGVAALEGGSSHTTSFIAKSCLFIGNSAVSDGSVVDGNTAGSSANKVNITNCSFYGNSVSGAGNTGAISGGATTTTTILNSILYGDTSPKEISTKNPSKSLTVTFSDIHQSGFAGSNGNINSDPLYTDPVNDDLHIPSASPATLTGTNSGAPALDYDNVPRPNPPSMGAFEPTIVATRFIVGAPASATAGTAFNATVTAEDDAGNVATSYAGMVHFTTTSSSYNLPADAALTNGTGTFSVKLNTTGSQTLTATDTAALGITGASGGINVAAGPAGFFALVAPAHVTAGTPFNITVNAFDSFGNAATDYTGPVSFNSGDPLATLPPNSALTGGTGTFAVTLATPGTQSIDAHDVASPGITGGTGPITVTSAAASQFIVNVPANATAGTAFNVTITAQNSGGGTVTDYSGTVHFTSNDPNAVLPADATLTNGTGTFNATLKTAGIITIRAKDTLNPSLTATVNVTVSAAAADHLKLAAPAAAIAGVAFYAIVSAEDVYGNIARSYTGTVHFTSADSQAILPGDLVLTGGAKQISIKLRSPGIKTVTATDTANSGLTAGAFITVGLVAAKFVITGPATAVAAGSNTFMITAKDTVGNTVTGYTGTVHFTITDPAGAVSADMTLVNGTGTFHATFKTAGTQTVTATDTVIASVKGTTTIVITPGATSKFVLTAPASIAAGAAFYSQITAQDKYGNVTKGYTGTVHFTSTDPLAVLPANVTLTNGTRQVSIKLKTHGSKTVTATDTVNAAIKGTSSAILVN